MKLIGIVLIVAGLAALAFGGISWVDRDTVANIGGLKVQTEERESIPLSPIFGVAAIIGGVALVAIGARSRTRA